MPILFSNKNKGIKLTAKCPFDPFAPFDRLRGTWLDLLIC